MPVVTLTEAAKALGFKSRSTLYRLKDSGDLADYIRPTPSPGQAGRLELTPRGLPPLKEHVARLIRLQINNEERAKRSRVDRRWVEVAELLNDALADHGGLQLCPGEAEAIATALPEAIAEAFGDRGLEWLRLALADAGCWWAGPCAQQSQEGAKEFWSEWGRWEPDAPMPDGEDFWEHVAKIVAGMVNGQEAFNAPVASLLFHELSEAVVSVRAGARWDQAKWDAADARLLLDDQGDDPPDPSTRDRLAALLEGGNLPLDLAEEVKQALARVGCYRKCNQSSACLPGPRELQV